MGKSNTNTQAPVVAVENIEAPVVAVQEQVAAEAVTTEATAPAVPAKEPKKKPYETTRTIEKFADDTKGIRAGSTVTIKEKGTEKVMTGTVQRLFDFFAKPERQEAKIMVTGADGKTKTRHYRFEKDITPVIAATEVPAPEVAAPEAAQ